MENDFTSPRHLTPITELMRKKESEINTLINNLKIENVKDDIIFSKTREKIIETIVPKLVEFGEPKFIDYEYEEKKPSMNQQLVGIYNANHYYHEISFPFSGDIELFNYLPESFSFTSSDRGVIIPDSQEVRVYVDLPEISPEKAIKNAKALFYLTKKIVTGNNESIAKWSKSIENRIDKQLESKRKELRSIFGY